MNDAASKDSDQSKMVLRHLDIVMALAGNEFGGIRNADICKVIGQPAHKVSRDLQNLIEAGWAEKLDNGHFRLGPKPVQVALAFATAVSRAETQLADVKNRYSRQP
jgi:DNA-binding IclR family transcriptional regulator